MGSASRSRNVTVIKIGILRTRFWTAFGCLNMVFICIWGRRQSFNSLYLLISHTQCSAYMLRYGSVHCSVSSPVLLWSLCHSAICEIGLKSEQIGTFPQLMKFSYYKLTKWDVMYHQVSRFKLWDEINYFSGLKLNWVWMVAFWMVWYICILQVNW